MGGVEEEEDGDGDDTSDVNIVTLPQDESQTMFDSYDAVIFERYLNLKFIKKMIKREKIYI